MSFKAIVFIVLILIVSTFAFLKLEFSGSPNSHFNQSTRFVLAKQPFMRFLFGLHNKGDARAEYLENTGPLVIDWLQPVTENVDGQVLQQFADLVAKYTGRKVQTSFGGNISSGTISMNSMGNLSIKDAPPPGSSIFYVVFATDYQPKDSAELSTTYGESTVVISLNANRQFLGNYQQDLDNYLLSDLLHEFGNEIGLNEQAATTDFSCIMNLHAGIDGQPLEDYGRTTPQDFCPAEVDEINSIKTSLQ